MRTFPVLVWGLVGWLAWPAGADSESWRRELCALPGGSGAQVACRVEDSDGRVVLDWDSDRLQLPASTLKTATGAAILEQGGAGQRLTTRLQAQGNRLRWLGDFDPELTAVQLEDMALQAAARVQGPVQIEIPGPEPEPYPPGWSWDDLSSGFAPPVGRLVFDHGLVALRVRTSADAQKIQVAGPAWVGPGEVTFVTGGDEFQMQLWPGWAGYVFQGRLPGSAEEAMSVPQLRPEAAAAQLLATVLQRRSIVCAQVAPDPKFQADWEVTHLSRPVSEVLAQGLADSDNLVLECLYRRFGRSRPLAWKDQTLRTVDGSGLSRYNLVSAHQLCQVVQSCPQVLELLPRAGLQGTLQRRFLNTGLAGKLRAKTGTMSGVSGLVGEFPGASGRSYRFALLIQGFVGASLPYKQAEDRLLLELHATL